MQKSRPARALWIEIKKERKCNMAGKASRPARALWIEMLPLRPPDWPYSSRPAGALWIEIVNVSWSIFLVASRPARALWIEIDTAVPHHPCPGVEAREGLVD